MTVSCYFEPRDLWVGVFWDRPKVMVQKRIPYSIHFGWTDVPKLHVYICLLPCCVIRLVF